jgi:hypothetical protein
MVQPHAIPAPPGDRAWEITFTRLAQAVRPRIEACALDLARRFQAIGVGSDRQVRPTPRGVSTFLALVGQRGLICIVDLTLVDGTAVGQGPCAVLDVRLLDACGEVVAEVLAWDLHDRCLDQTSAVEALSKETLERAATTVFVATLGHFDLLRPVACSGDRAS